MVASLLKASLPAWEGHTLPARTAARAGGTEGAVPACLLPPGPRRLRRCGDKKVAFDAVGIVFALFLPLSNWQLVLLCLF